VPSSRQEEIRFLLQEHGHLTVAELAKMLNVSEMTIRRDLKTLAQMGLIQREHGGAYYPQRSNQALFVARLGEAEREKTAIGKKATELINENDSIILDAGTTTLALAKALYKKCVVITNSLPISSILADRENITVLLTGGEVRESTYALVGPMTRNNLMSFNVDKVFLGATGVSLEKGLSTANMLESEVKQAMIRSAREVILLAHSAKIGVVQYHTFAQLNQVDILVTDCRIDPQVRSRIEKMGVKVVIAE